MMLKNIHKGLVATFLIGTLTLMSCEDWLTVEPQDDLLKENFWKKTDDVYGALGAVYNSFRDASLESFLWGEIRADLVEINENDPFADFARIAQSNISPTNGAVNWSKYYRTINLANTLMFYNKQVHAIDRTFTKERMDAVDAEALFLRSLSYFYLVRVWKDVPLVVNPSLSDTSNMFIPKSSEKEVIRRVIKDLEKAKDMAYTTELMDDTDNPAFRSGRANKYAIMALMADMYLWNEQYELASSYCDSVINSGLYNLETGDNFFLNFFPGNTNESIFEIQFDDNLISQENPIYYNLLPINGTPQMNVKPQLLSLLFDESDIRTLNLANPLLPLPLLKYYGTSLTSPIGRSENQRDANFMYYRFSDITLIKAEALNELGRFADANFWLSQTKDRAGLSHIDINTKEGLRVEILNERAKEFLVEGKRWFDVLRVAKRNNFEQKQLIISMILSGADVKQKPILESKVFDTLSYYLPIPDRDIRSNPNLIQNPYYTR